MKKLILVLNSDAMVNLNRLDLDFVCTDSDSGLYECLLTQAKLNRLCKLNGLFINSVNDIIDNEDGYVWGYIK